MSSVFNSISAFLTHRWGGLAVGAALLGGGCVSVDTIAPPVATLSGGGGDAVVEGRRLYLTTCTKCHSAEPVLDFTAAQWATILPEMAEESHFTSTQTAAVEAYIQAVLATASTATETR